MTDTPDTPPKAQGGLGQFDDVMGEMATPKPRVTQTDRIEAAVARLQDEAKCRDRVDQALQYLEFADGRGALPDLAPGNVIHMLRRILLGAHDLKTLKDTP